MQPFIGAFLLLSTSILSAFPVMAACGGGGYKPAKTTKVVAQREERRQEPSYRQERSAGRESRTNFDTSRFDSISGRLNLNDYQSQEISKAKTEISDRLSKAQLDVEIAQKNLERCQENCANEERKLAEARARLNAFDAKIEFDRRLGSVLTESQFKIYNSPKS